MDFFEAGPGQAPHRGDQRYCKTHKRYLHYSKFCKRQRRTPDGAIWEYDEECKACQQIKRNEKKNEDRARALVERRAISRASKLGVPRKKLLDDMHYLDLVPYVRAMLTDEGVCVDCGHKFQGEPDIQFEHREPPREDPWPDWAREHAKNITLACGNCNLVKSDKPWAMYLDDSEEARLINERHQQSVRHPLPPAAPTLLPGFNGFNAQWSIKK